MLATLSFPYSGGLLYFSLWVLSNRRGEEDHKSLYVSLWFSLSNGKKKLAKCLQDNDSEFNHFEDRLLDEA